MTSPKIRTALLVLWTSVMMPIHLSNAAVSGALITPSMPSVSGAFTATAAHASAVPNDAAAPGASSSPAPPSPPEALQSTMPDSANSLTAASLKEAVDQWIRTIGQENGYEAWRQATWSSYPLGPGTHGWIVLLQAGGKDIGYMVIHAADPNQADKYRLTEYGSGGKPLFSEQTLYQSLVQLELIDSSYETERWYVDPLHALWKVRAGERHYYIDAKSGELLPDIPEDFFLDSSIHIENRSNPDEEHVSEHSEGLLTSLHPKKNVTSLTSRHSIKESLILPEFDPYDKLSWVKGSPSTFASISELRAELQQQRQFVFAAELYDSKVFVPLAITGYQRWSNDETFITLEQHGKRAIPYALIVSQGKLFLH
jgi:hypothetical protein